MVRAPCCEKVGLKRGRWTAEEDELLLKYIQANGQGSWRSLPKSAGLLRCGKSCRLRWTNYLRPDLKRGHFTSEEDESIVKLQCSLGNRWSLIANYLPGRTDNEIKNYWNSHLRRRIYTFTMKKKPIKTTAEVLTQKITIVADGINFKSLRKRGRVSRSKAKKYNSNTLKPKSSCVGASGGATRSKGDSIEFHSSENFTVDTALLEGKGLDMQQQVLDEHIPIIGPHEKMVHLQQQPNHCLIDFGNQVSLSTSGVLEVNEESHENWWSTMTSDNFLEDELWVDQCMHNSLDLEFESCEKFNDMSLWLWDDIN